MEQEYKEEIWRDVGVYDGVDFTGCYEVSNKGGVRALDRIIMRKNGRKQIKDGHIMRQYDDGHGYMKVFLKKNGKMKSPKVHQLVALRFIPNPDPEHKTQVNHIDEDKTNNCVENLEWVTAAENHLHFAQSNRLQRSKARKQRTLINKSLQFILENKDCVLREYDAGCSIVETAEKCGVGRDMARDILMIYGRL